jgi:hypothetical protein
MQLTEVADEAKKEILEYCLHLMADPPMADCGRTIERLSALFQGYAICMLLTEGDDQQFREHLRRSASAHRYYRRKSVEQGNIEDRHLAISRSEAFLDALVAGELELARDLARLSPTTWRKGWEYEDDWCYFQLLYLLLEEGEDFGLPRATPLLERFEQILEGDSSPRLDYCRAVAERDQDSARQALQDLLDEKAARDDARRPNVVGSQFLFWPQSFVCIEGLAWFRLAELAGFSLPGTYPYCPPEARLPLATEPFTDIFLQLEAAIAADR